MWGMSDIKNSPQNLQKLFDLPYMKTICNSSLNGLCTEYIAHLVVHRFSHYPKTVIITEN